MLPRVVRLHPGTYRRLLRLSKEAERDGAYRVAKRLQAVLLNSQGRTSGELAEVLQAPRSKVSEWLARYQAHGVEGLLEGQRSGRPAELTVSVWGTASPTGGGLAMPRGPGRRGQFGDALNRSISQAGQHVAEIIADWDLEAAAAFDDR